MSGIWKTLDVGQNLGPVIGEPVSRSKTAPDKNLLKTTNQRMETRTFPSPHVNPPTAGRDLERSGPGPKSPLKQIQASPAEMKLLVQQQILREITPILQY